MKRTLVALAAVSAISAVHCGLPPNRRLLTRPSEYNKAAAFPSDGNPVDIRRIERDFPELKGIVMTAPEYIEEYARLKAQAEAEGRAVIPYKIPAGAQLSIEVEGEPNLSRNILVPPTGYYDYPLIGEIRVEGLTDKELKANILAKLEKILKRPVVHINVLSNLGQAFTQAGLQATPTSSASQIYVFGAVSTAFLTGSINYTGGQTLSTILGLTGLPGSAEWRQIRVIRRDPKDPLRKSRVIIADWWNFLALGDVRQDIPLMPGDIVYVPVKWTLGDQFQNDWNLFWGYINSAIGNSFTVNGLRQALQPNGAFRQ